MERVCGRVLAGLTLLVGGGAVMSACVHNDSSIFIQNVLAQQLVAAGQMCKFTSDPTQAYISGGRLDIAIRGEYDAVFLVGNQMVPEANPQTPTTETSTVRVEGAIVRITDASGAQLRSYTTPLGATLYPATGTTPGYTPIGATIVDQMTVTKLAGSSVLQATPTQSSGVVHLVTYTRFFGHTLGGRYIESDEFGFPVDVCNHCLLPICINTTTMGSTSSASTEPIPCELGQDVAIDCPTCMALGLASLCQ
jgi:hypothetical protein